ncbi:MAG: hypothetical protein IPM85_00760 [Chitinophagaceae bacterium]|nr:hypothetical protein [Chitinophagaceae bacterium]
MKKFTSLKGFLSLLFFTIFTAKQLSAQTASITPKSSIAIGSFSNINCCYLQAGFGGDNNNRTFVYTITGPGATVPASPYSVNCTSGCNSESVSFQFPTAGTYSVSVTVTQTQGGSAVATTSTNVYVVAPPASPNLWATSSDGNQVPSFSVTNGFYFAVRQIYSILSLQLHVTTASY